MGSTTLFVPLAPRSGRVGKSAGVHRPNSTDGTEERNIVLMSYTGTTGSHSLKRASPRKTIIKDMADNGLVYNKTTWQCPETFFFFALVIVGDWG